MWHLRSALTSLLLILASSAPVSAEPSGVADSSRGPAPAQEAPLLWERSQTSLNEKKYQDAINDLTRLIDRHPEFSKNTEARILLGTAFLNNQQATKALETLKPVQDSLRDPELKQKVRNLIGESYLQTSQFRQALLNQTEAFTVSKNKDALAGSLKAQAQIRLGQYGLAEKTIDQVERLHPSPDRIAFLRLDLKISRCSRLVISEPADEGQVKSILNRQGVCLSEAAPLLGNVLSITSPQSVWKKQSLDRFDQGIQFFDQTCATPPPPAGKRSAQQKKAYQEELIQALTRDCSHIKQKIQELFQGEVFQKNSSELQTIYQHLSPSTAGGKSQ